MDGLPALSTHGCSFNPGQAGIPVCPEEDPATSLHNMQLIKDYGAMGSWSVCKASYMITKKQPFKYAFKFHNHLL